MIQQDSQKRRNERAKVAVDAERLLEKFEELIEKFPKNLKYSGSNAALLKYFGASMYARINCASYSTNDIVRRREFIEAALGDYETVKLQKRILFSKRGKGNEYYVSLEQLADLDELLASVGRQLVGLKKSLDDIIDKANTETGTQARR